MLVKLAALLAIVGVSSVQAQAELYECDKYTQPNYDVYGQCAVFTDGKRGNCAISVCNVRGDGADAYLNVMSGEAHYTLLKRNCKPAEAGGRAPGSASGYRYYLKATATPDNFATSGTIRDGSRSTNPQLRVDLMIMEEMEDFWERARNAIARLEESTWETTEGFSVGVAVSAGVSVGFFDLFTASINIEVSFEYTQSYSRSITIDPSKPCSTGQDAYMYFEPYFDHYTVMDGNNEVHEIWIPKDGGKMGVQCLG
ncbi:hypothetical protein BDW02DRAFT_612135 [Decorospora gaudefroyi]|uniref:Cyanovirin-N domain-containing protein n=1 Tax=Decorospora gaudefroyi TaxID=184978 RepID=A0A6A5JZW4_9PLEO|nr:hypothetical protein BDW02DRAFT_612135 [Decorospora gaudefroyi]